jgi:hypothetical protein
MNLMIGATAIGAMAELPSAIDPIFRLIEAHRSAMIAAKKLPQGAFPPFGRASF